MFSELFSTKNPNFAAQNAACSAAKFVVKGTGEEYHPPEIEPNRKSKEHRREQIPSPSFAVLGAGNVSDKHLASPRTTVRRSTSRYLCHQRQLFDPREPQSRSPAEQGSRIADTRKLGKCPDLGFSRAQCDGLSGGAGLRRLRARSSWHGQIYTKANRTRGLFSNRHPRSGEGRRRGGRLHQK